MTPQRVPATWVLLIGLSALLLAVPLAATALEAPPWATPSWIQTDKITPQEATEPGWNDRPHHHFARFGASMDTHDGRLIVGAYGVDGAYIFDWNDDRWEQTGTIEPDKNILASTGSADDVDIHDDIVAIGASRASYLGMTSHGVAYIYEESEPGRWTETKTIAEGQEAHARAGLSVAAGDDTVAVGIPYQGSGIVQVYEKSDGEWYLTAELNGPTDRPSSFGRTVKIHDGTIFASATRGDLRATGAGLVNVYERTPEGWAQSETIMPEEPVQSFGYSLDIDEAIAIVGAPYSDRLNGEDVHDTATLGEAFVYERTADGWEQTASFDNPVPIPRDPFLGLTKGPKFGFDVAIQEDTAVVGTQLAEPQGTGAAYVYERVEDPFLRLDEGGWEFAERLVYNETFYGDWAGDSVEIDGDTILLGVPYDTNRRDVPVHPVSKVGNVPLVLGYSGAYAGSVYEFQKGASDAPRGLQSR